MSTRLEAEVSDSASSCRRGEPVKPVSAKPGGASRPSFTSPICTAKGVAQLCRESEARKAARRTAGARTAIILSPAYHRGFRTIRGRWQLGGDSRKPSQGAEG